MKLFGKGRKKGEDTVVETSEIVEVSTEETIEDIAEESIEESETDVEVVTEESEEETEMDESLVETSEEVITEKLDHEKTLEELDEEVEEEVRLTELLPVDEVNQALEETQELSEKALKRKRIRKIVFRTIGGILGTTLLVYLAGAVFFHYNFFYNTTVNGTDVSFQSVKAVHGILEEGVNNYELTMVTSDGTKEVISGNLMNMGYKESQDVDAALELQMAYKWPMMFFKDRDFKIDVEITFNEDILVETFTEMDSANPLEIVEPVNAYPSYVDGEVVIIEEIYGNNFVEDAGDILIDAVYNMEEEIVLLDAKAYVAPTYTSESQEVKDAEGTMHQFLKAEISYNEGDKITSEQIGSWLKVNVETLEVGLDSSKVEEFIKGLEDKYNTYGNNISFTNPVGKKATVTGGNFGTRVNKTTEAEQIVADIKTGESVNRDIKYSQKGSSSSTPSNPFGDTYICLDLSLQKVYVQYKGAVVLTSSVVTGDVAKGMATPQGVFTMTYKTKNAVLRAPLRPDGTREYETPVSYWIPFNGGIGFHDATWRSAFGGTIYKNNGSHGCVNMPLANVAKLYDYVQANTPIVCHY